MEIKNILKKIPSAVVVAALLSGAANTEPQFLPGHLAVLRAGDGRRKLCTSSRCSLTSSTPTASNPAPSFTVRIPTNGHQHLVFQQSCGHRRGFDPFSRPADAGLRRLWRRQSAQTTELLRCWISNAGPAPWTFRNDPHVSVSYGRCGGKDELQKRNRMRHNSAGIWQCGGTFLLQPERQQGEAGL